MSEPYYDGSMKRKDVISRPSIRLLEHVDVVLPCLHVSIEYISAIIFAGKHVCSIDMCAKNITVLLYKARTNVDTEL